MKYAQLPAVGATLNGGIFAGLTTRTDGTHCAVVALPGNAGFTIWQEAKAWAAVQGGELPTRPVAALLVATVEIELAPEWHWTADEYNDSLSWSCDFVSGYQDIHDKNGAATAVAVRLIPITEGME